MKTENPDLNQVDNFSIDDSEVDQPVYEGPQTRSHTRKLMKANCLMANLFDIETGEICDDVSDVIVVVPEVNDKSIRDLVWNSGTNRSSCFTVSVVTWLKPGRIPFIARQDSW